MSLLKTVLVAALLALPFSVGAHAGAGKKDIVDTAAAAGKFETLITAAKAAGLVETLKGDGPLTVFAPTDAAFAKLPDGTVDNLLKPENKDQLAAILKYHVVPGKVMSSDIKGKKLDTETVEGRKVMIDATSGVTVGGAKVTQADVEASNGVIHIVDTVIMPPAA
jgi:uncharacterized surface protein with fasciclin (FAS1) repeats